MISRPLFIIVAESTVIFGPITQLGWCSASPTLTRARVSRGRSRKGPPLAVSTSRLTLAGSSPRRHCQRALCSLSTGISRDPDAPARARGRGGPRRGGCTKTADRGGEGNRVVPGDGTDQLEALRMAGDDVAGLPADRAGRAEEDDPPHGAVAPLPAGGGVGGCGHDG